jgi:hypothetical protein
MCRAACTLFHICLFFISFTFSEEGGEIEDMMLSDVSKSFDMQYSEWYSNTKTCEQAHSISACPKIDPADSEEPNCSSSHRYLLLLNSWEKLSWATIGEFGFILELAEIVFNVFLQAYAAC